MKSVLWAMIVLTLAACGGESKTANAKQPAPNNSLGDSAVQMRQKAVGAAKSVEQIQQQQTQQIDEQTK